MNNKKDNRAKFFAQYWGSPVFEWIYPEHATREGIIVSVPDLKIYASCYFLRLKPLSEITDEDAIAVIGGVECSRKINDERSFYYGMSPSEVFLDTLVGYSDSYHIDTWEMDYLRSKGYALPWLNISVEEQLEWGWIKFK